MSCHTKWGHVIDSPRRDFGTTVQLKRKQIVNILLENIKTFQTTRLPPLRQKLISLTEYQTWAEFVGCRSSTCSQGFFFFFSVLYGFPPQIPTLPNSYSRGIGPLLSITFANDFTCVLPDLRIHGIGSLESIFSHTVVFN